MPFDGDLEAFTKPDVFSLRGLIAWLETQDPATEYKFEDCNGGCLIGQYLMALTGKMWRDHGLTWADFDFGPYAALGNVAVEYPHTFAGALTRARALLGETP